MSNIYFHRFSMAETRTRSGRTFGPRQSRTTSARVEAIAQDLYRECTMLLELYRKKENFPPEVTVTDDRLVSVPSPSSQLSTKDRLWCLYSALQQCRGLLERAISREEEQFDGGAGGEYESQRTTVRNRLGYLLGSMGSLLEEMNGVPAIAPNHEGAEIDGLTNGSLFELKLWIYRVFSEVEYWSNRTIATLRTLPSDRPKDGGRSRVRRGMPK